MLVVENVILTEAMVAGAAGAVAELQLGVVGVGSSAHSALVAIAPLRLLFLLLADGGLELNGLAGILVPDTETELCQQVRDAVPEKDGVDQPDGQQIKQIPKPELENAQDRQHHIQHRQPLGLDGENELNTDHSGGVQGGEGQE